MKFLSASHYHREPRPTPPQAAVQAVVTMQFAEDMYRLLDSEWAIAATTDGGAWHPLAAFGACCESGACALETRELLAGHRETEAPFPGDSPLRIACRLVAGGRTVGAVSFGPKRNAPCYSASDATLLADAAAQIGSLLENDRLSWHLASRIVETQQTRRELESAREVLSRFSPGQFPQVKGVDYYGECVSSGPSSRDYFDFSRLQDGALAIVMGRVSERDVPAAIVLAALQSALRNLAARAKPGQMVTDLNHLVCDLCPENLYATLFYARIEPDRSAITYVNAGHEPALLVRAGTRRIHRLGAGGTVLGLTRHSAYEQATIPLHGGEILAASTDEVGASEEILTGFLRERPNVRARDLVTEMLYETGARREDRTAVAARIDAAEREAPMFVLAEGERTRVHQAVAA